MSSSYSDFATALWKRNPINIINAQPASANVQASMLAATMAAIMPEVVVSAAAVAVQVAHHGKQSYAACSATDGTLLPGN